MKLTPQLSLLALAGVCLALFAAFQFFSQHSEPTAIAPAVPFPQKQTASAAPHPVVTAPTPKSLSTTPPPGNCSLPPYAITKTKPLSPAQRPSAPTSAAPRSPANRSIPASVSAPAAPSTTASSSTPATVSPVASAAALPAALADAPVYELEPGIRAPIALINDNAARTPAQAAALDQVAQSFDASVAAAVGSSSNEPTVSAEAFDAARAAADANYRLLFGDEAYNSKLLEAAREALQ